MSDGPHHLVVQAWDDSGGVTKNRRYIIVSKPAIAIASPPATTQVYSPVEIVATTQDQNLIYAVKLYVDGVLQYEFSGTGLQIPLSIASGTHSLALQVWDVAGGTYKTSETVHIKR
jgi:Bacterial Ig domain